MVAIVLACALAAFPLVVGDRLNLALAPLAAVGLLCAAFALFLRVRFAAGALFAFAFEYIVVRATDRVGSLSVIAYAVGLLVFSELVFWLEQLPPQALVDRCVLLRCSLNVALAGTGAAALALLSLLAAALEFPGASLALLVGIAAAAALLAMPWSLLRARRRDDVH